LAHQSLSLNALLKTQVIHVTQKNVFNAANTSSHFPVNKWHFGNECNNIYP